MENNGKIGCWGWITLLILIGLVSQCIDNCSTKHHKRQDIEFPAYALFYRDGGDPEIIFQTFDSSKNLACLNYTWSSGQMAEMYVIVRNGNELYDGNDTFVGYIIVQKDGSFKMKGAELENGDFYSKRGDKLKVKKQK